MDYMDQQLVELGHVPEIYCDGVGRIYLTGSMARMQLFSWQTVGGVWHPVKVVTIIRPSATLVGLDAMTRAAKRVHLEGVPELHH